MVAAVASYFSKINIILWGGEREDAIFSFPFKTYFFNKDFFENNEKRGDTCDEKSQISPLKRQGKGSLLLPCQKMPIGIFLFSLKSDFQKVRKTAKNEENPRKSRVLFLASFLSRRIGGATRTAQSAYRYVRFRTMCPKTKAIRFAYRFHF